MSSVTDLKTLSTLAAVPAKPLQIGLNERDVTKTGVRHIARALTLSSSGRSPPLTELLLANCQLKEEGVTSLGWAAMKGGLRELKRLVLTGNGISRLSGLAPPMREGSFPSLQVLYLASNRIRPEGLADLAQAVSYRPSPLTQLWLDHNEIGEGDVRVGADALATIARACPKLTVLDIAANGLKDGHLDALATAIMHGTAFASDERTRIEVSLNLCSGPAILRLSSACDARGNVRVSA